MSDIQDLTNQIIKFNEERNWDQYHNPKDVAISLLLEAAELLEHFQWKNEVEVEEHVKAHKQEIADELADTFVYLFQMCHSLEIDIIEASKKKISKNAIKYPVEKSKDKYLKYNQL